MDNTPVIITSFLAYKETIQNSSPLTVREYHLDLRTFFRYIIATREGRYIATLEEIDISKVDEGLAGSVTADEVYSFLLFLSKEKKNKASARARKLSAIKSFYKYHTAKSKKLKDNPTKDIDSPAIKSTLPKHLSLDESIRLLDSVDVKSKTYRRDYCIITMFLNTGIRLAELVSINLSDIEADLSKMVVTGKGNKMRTIYLNAACRDALESYIKVRARDAMATGKTIIDKDALFLSGQNKRISNKTVQWMIKKQLDMSGLGGKGYSVHKLRHTAATLMYNTGNVDVRALKDILGHEQLTTTQIYTHVSDKKLQDAMEANPLSNKK